MRSHSAWQRGGVNAGLAITHLLSRSLFVNPRANEQVPGRVPGGYRTSI